MVVAWGKVLVLRFVFAELGDIELCFDNYLARELDDWLEG